MRKLAVVLLFAAAALTLPAAASETVLAMSATTGIAAPASAAPSLQVSLDKAGQQWKEMWIKDKQGRKVKRVCYLECTNYCSTERNACYYQYGSGATFCEDLYNECMCVNNCCSGPYGNPYCDDLGIVAVIQHPKRRRNRALPVLPPASRAEPSGHLTVARRERRA
jgi:hypothetical protein